MKWATATWKGQFLDEILCFQATITIKIYLILWKWTSIVMFFFVHLNSLLHMEFSWMLETLLVPCSQTRLTQENHRFLNSSIFIFIFSKQLQQENKTETSGNFWKSRCRILSWILSLLLMLLSQVQKRTHCWS